MCKVVKLINMLDIMNCLQVRYSPVITIVMKCFLTREYLDGVGIRSAGP